jgi:hypothetical protein
MAAEAMTRNDAKPGSSAGLRRFKAIIRNCPGVMAGNQPHVFADPCTMLGKGTKGETEPQHRIVPLSRPPLGCQNSVRERMSRRTCSLRRFSRTTACRTFHHAPRRRSAPSVSLPLLLPGKQPGRERPPTLARCLTPRRVRRGSLTPRLLVPDVQDERCLNENFVNVSTSGKLQSSPEQSRRAARHRREDNRGRQC